MGKKLRRLEGENRLNYICRHFITKVAEKLCCHLAMDVKDFGDIRTQRTRGSEKPGKFESILNPANFHLLALMNVLIEFFEMEYIQRASCNVNYSFNILKGRNTRCNIIFSHPLL